MHNLKIITSTTREARKGIIIAEWITRMANRIDGFNVELLDLATINLPFMNEPNHPRLRRYQYDHTKRWSEKISQSDAFIIVLAEYNYGFPAPIKNAIDYLFVEWKHKPVGFVSYGGVGGGLRATQMLKQVVTTLSMMPLTEQVTIPFFPRFIHENGTFVPEEAMERAAEVMFSELARWSEIMKQLRKQ